MVQNHENVADGGFRGRRVLDPSCTPRQGGGRVLSFAEQVFMKKSHSMAGDGASAEASSHLQLGIRFLAVFCGCAAHEQ